MLQTTAPVSFEIVALAGSLRQGSYNQASQLRQSFVFTNTPVLPQPEVLVGRAHEKFASDGRLTDAMTRKCLVLFLEAFAN